MNTETVRVAWVGAGVMGAPMAGHLLKAGHAVRIFSRTRAKVDALIAAGAEWVDSPAAAAEGADVAFAMVAFPKDVEEVFLGTKGFLAAKHPPKVVVDMGTSPPALTRRIAEAAVAKGVGSLDAPVSGGDIGARNATLSIMVGGEVRDFEAVKPLFEFLGKTIVHQGAAGAGQLCKMVNQILVANSMIGACEAMVAAKATGLDPERMLQSVSTGAAGSWTLSNLVPRMLKGDWAPGFFASLLAKDLQIAVDEMKAVGHALPGLEVSERLYRRLDELGHGGMGTQGLLKVWAEVLGEQKLP
ncbi:MAG: NAD(P)-dependent oxidoreductase [Planctomycetaceae bacterium]|nr:NAD(P)-dependent oxidoreductase [Planctomycetaceae bacterium]